MSITCKFELSRSSNIFYSGEEIAGSITICGFKQRRIEDIILEFYGKSTVQWWETDKTKENIMYNDFSTHEVSNKTLYKRHQKHVCEQLKLGSSLDKQLQPHVEYTFRFCFSIPQQAPATYRCRYGQTDYGLRLQMRRTKKANKEFHQRIVVKNKLDLTEGIIYKKSCNVLHRNEVGQINLQIPCSGFTPGQKIPYYYKYQTTENDCKMLIQFNCYSICRTQSNCNTFKQIKEVVNYKKHLSSEISSCVNIPLSSHVSSINDPDLILSSKYTLEAFLVNSSKKVLLCATIPLTIGTTPCCTFNGGFENYMCYDNFGSSSTELFARHTDAKFIEVFYSFAEQQFESFWILPIKQKTHLRKYLSCCYKTFNKYL